MNQERRVWWIYMRQRFTSISYARILWQHQRDLVVLLPCIQELCRFGFFFSPCIWHCFITNFDDFIISSRIRLHYKTYRITAGAWKRTNYTCLLPLQCHSLRTYLFMLWPGRQACHFTISISKPHMDSSIFIVGTEGLMNWTRNIGQNMALILEVSLNSRCAILSFVANLMLYQSSIPHFLLISSSLSHAIDYRVCGDSFKSVFHFLNNVPNRTSSGLR